MWEKDEEEEEASGPGACGKEEEKEASALAVCEEEPEEEASGLDICDVFFEAEQAAQPAPMGRHRHPVLGSKCQMADGGDPLWRHRPPAPMQLPAQLPQRPQLPAQFLARMPSGYAAPVLPPAHPRRISSSSERRRCGPRLPMPSSGAIRAAGYRKG